MASIPFEYGLLLAGVLFALGMVGVIVRRNLLFILLCVEVMLNAAGLAFVVGGARWGQPDGQAMFISAISPMQGPADTATTVTITGQGFVAPVSVIYDPTSTQLQWTVLSVAGTQIVVKSVPLPSPRQCSGGAAKVRVKLEKSSTARVPTT